MVKNAKKVERIFFTVLILKKKIAGTVNIVITNKLYGNRPIKFKICKISLNQVVL